MIDYIKAFKSTFISILKQHKMNSRNSNKNECPFIVDIIQNHNNEQRIQHDKISFFRKTKKAKSFLKKESKKEIALLQYYVNVYNLDIS